MENSLLVSKQFTDSHLLAANPEPTSMPKNVQAASNEDLMFFVIDSGWPETWQSPGRNWLPRWTAWTHSRRYSNERHAFRRNSMARAQHALETIEAIGKERQSRKQIEDEARWIAENKARFVGKWVALSGNKLLASGDSAREVFKATGNVIPTPLVIQIEHDDLPFAGW